MLIFQNVDLALRVMAKKGFFEIEGESIVLFFYS